MDTSFVKTREVQVLFDKAAGLNQPGGDPRLKAIFRDLVEAGDAQGQRQGEDQARPGVEPLRRLERQAGAAEHALEAPHQVVVTD